MKTTFISTFTYTLTLAFLITGCTHSQKKTPPINGISNQTQSGEKTNGSYYTIVTFDTGTSKLTKKSKESLKEFMNKTRTEGAQSKEIKILTFPDVARAQEKDVLLAARRALAIMKFMKKKLNTKEDLLAFNMTNRTSVLNAILESDDPKTKKVFEKTGPIAKEGEDLAALKSDQSGKALIIRDFQ